MNDLVVKQVNFNGDSLLAVKENKSNKIYVGVSFICNGIGLTENQKDRQVKNIQQDIVLKNSIKNLPVRYDGQIRNVICIELDYLPLWLAKISITPSMKDNNPEVVTRLIEYQLRAKDILAKQFIINDSFKIPETYSEALKLASSFQKQLEDQKPKVALYDAIMNTSDLLNFKEVADTFGLCGRNTLMKILREEKVLSSNNCNRNLPYSKYTKAGLFKVKIVPRKTNNGVEEICTTLCTTKSLKFIKKILDKKKDLLKQAN